MQHKLLISLFLYLFIGCAWANQVHVITTDSTSEFIIALEAVLQNHSKPRPELKIVNLKDLDTKYDFYQQTKDGDLIVTVGYEATLYTLLKNPPQKVLATEIHKYSFEQLKTRFASDNQKLSAIVVDQPLERSINLIRAIFPKDQAIGTIGVLVGPNSTAALISLNELTLNEGICFKTAKVENTDNPINALNYLMHNAKLLLAVPDPVIFNRKTARGLLVTASRNNLPIIAFSKKYVDMGALATVYSTPTQIAQQTAETLLHCEDDFADALPEIQYPHDFKVELNYQVARNFGLAIDSSNSIQYQIEDYELPAISAEDDN